MALIYGIDIPKIVFKFQWLLTCFSLKEFFYINKMELAWLIGYYYHRHYKDCFHQCVSLCRQPHRVSQRSQW